MKLAHQILAEIQDSARIWCASFKSLFQINILNLNLNINESL